MAKFKEKLKTQPGGITENEIIKQFDLTAFDVGKPEEKAGMIARYKELRSQKMPKLDAFSQTLSEFEKLSPTKSNGKTDLIFDYLWK